ncbi:hypothetical protein Btru_061084 [Bulinus truncatus]|nr:hypothetical protein Btru_061084 [Bulinus truncatus]
MEFSRTASYRPIIFSHPQPDVYYIQLSEAGFKYVAGDFVECVGCGKSINIYSFKQTSPHASCFHNNHCCFIQFESDAPARLFNAEQNPSSSIKHVSLSAEEVMTDGPSGYKRCVMPLTQSFEQISEHMQPEVFVPHDSPPGPKEYNFEDVAVSSLVDNEDCVSAHVSEGLAEIQQQSESVTFDYSELFSAEIEIGSNNNSDSAENRRRCKKNPGRFAYFSPIKVRPEQLPSHTRIPDMLRFLHVFSQLVARVVLTRKRKEGLRYVIVEDKMGTGSLSLTDDIVECQVSHKYRLGRVQKYMSNLVKRKPRWFLNILTSKHLVENDEDAANTRAEFFYDEPTRAGLKSVKGVSVQHSEFVGVNTVILVCVTSDAGFVQRISTARQDVLEIADRLPRSVKERLCKKMFIISHAHGREKVLSYGDSVPVMYVLRTVNPTGLPVIKPVKIKSTEVGDESPRNLRKAFLYAIDTCDGSTGAPIISFKKSGARSEEPGVTYQLDIWVHNGVDKVHSLGCSNLKEYTEEDLSLQSDPGETLAGQSDTDSDSERHTKIPNYSSVLKVQTSPQYPDFVTYQKRLESCATWSFSHIHRPEILSLTGFFYSGYSDCIRCFYCGLGLKSWKPGDDIFKEHEKYRPSCAYLKHLVNEFDRDGGTGALGDLLEQKMPLYENASSTAFIFNSSNSGPADDTVEGIELALLEMENRRLKEQMLCKRSIELHFHYHNGYEKLGTFKFSIALDKSVQC